MLCLYCIEQHTPQTNHCEIHTISEQQWPVEASLKQVLFDAESNLKDEPPYVKGGYLNKRIEHDLNSADFNFKYINKTVYRDFCDWLLQILEIRDRKKYQQVVEQIKLVKLVNKNQKYFKHKFVKMEIIELLIRNFYDRKFFTFDIIHENQVKKNKSYLKIAKWQQKKIHLYKKHLKQLRNLASSNGCRKECLRCKPKTIPRTRRIKKEL